MRTPGKYRYIYGWSMVVIAIWWVWNYDMNLILVDYGLAVALYGLLWGELLSREIKSYQECRTVIYDGCQIITVFIVMYIFFLVMLSGVIGELVGSQGDKVMKFDVSGHVYLIVYTISVWALSLWRIIEDSSNGRSKINSIFVLYLIFLGVYSGGILTVMVETVRHYHTIEESIAGGMLGYISGFLYYYSVEYLIRKVKVVSVEPELKEEEKEQDEKEKAIIKEMTYNDENKERDTVNQSFIQQ